MRTQAFVLPITLFVLLLIAGFYIGVFALQQTHVESLKQTTSAEVQKSQVIKLSNQSKVGAENIWQGVERNEIILDGLYNLNHLVETTALGGRIVNPNQVSVLERVLKGCGLESALVPGLASYLLQTKTPARNVSILDIIAELEIPSDNFTKMLFCLRLTSPLKKINFAYASSSMIASILDISLARAEKIKRLIQEGNINNKGELIAFFGGEAKSLNLDKKTMKLTVGPNYEHAAIYWTEQNETFAFFDQSLDKNGAWRLNWNVVLWVPEIIK